MARRDALWMVCFLILGALGLTSFVKLYDDAFPVASLNFKVDREQAHQAGTNYLQNLGYDLQSYESAQVFSQSSLSQVFLERTLGLAETNRLIREWISAWYWRIRWFKPLQKEELRVHIDPGGRIVGFTHSILESDEGASLSQDAARVIAERFLTDIQNFQLSDYDPIEASSRERPNRMDHTFAYRKKDFIVGDDGHYRLSVTVKGDKVGNFSEYLKVPETFSREYREIRSRAGLLSNIASVFFFALGVAMVIILVQKYRQHTLVWRAAFAIGILVTGANLVGSLNAYPLTQFGFDTTQSFPSFLFNFLFGSLFSALFLGALISLSGTAGGATAQEIEGWRNPIAQLSLKGWRSSSLAQTTLIGYGLAFAHLGYVTIFYIIGNDYLGIWSPAGMNQYSNTYSTYLPWIYPLLTGLVAATMEEFFFRLLAISLLIRWLGKPWLAVLIPAIVWAFLHANYPQEPIYIRGLELTVVGIIFGIVFLKYGVWTTIVSHYVYNCFLGIYPMVQSDNLYFKVSGILAVSLVFIPAIPAIFGLITGRYKEVEEPEEDIPKPPPIETLTEPEPIPQPEPNIERKTPADYLVPQKGLIVIGAFAIICFGLYFGIDNEQYGEYARQKMITRAEAIQKAEEYRQQLGLNLEGYKRTVWFSSGMGSSHYTHLIRNTTLSHADTLVAHNTSTWHWHVRWFKPLEKEELTISINRNGALSRMSHAIPESSEGTELSTEDAQKIAEAFLNEHLNRDVTDLALYKRLEDRSQKRENRMDHTFVWERTDIKVADGEFRVQATVQGDKIGSVYAYYKAPEEFLRKLRERGIKSSITSIISTVVIIALIVLIIIHFLQLYRKSQISWQFPIRLGIFIAIMMVLDKINGLPNFYQSYNTSTALSTFIGGEMTSLLVQIPVIGLLGTLIVAIGNTMYQQERPEEMQVANWVDVFRLKTIHTSLWRQVIFLAVCWFGITKGTSTLTTYMHQTYLHDYLFATSGTPPSINTFFPALSELIDEINGLLLAPFGVLGFLFIWWKTVRKINYLIITLLLALLFQSVISPAKDFYHASMLLAIMIPGSAIKLFVILRYIRFNFLFYAVTAWYSLITGGFYYLKFEPSICQINGIILIVLGSLPLILALLAWRKGQTQ